MKLIAKVFGNSKICGEIEVGGAKNAALPIIAATLATSKKVVLERIPNLSDVKEMISMIEKAGMQVSFKENRASFFAKDLDGDLSEASSKIRASILLLGPLALKTGHVFLPYPGGCSIGKRPVDLHLKGLKKLGFKILVNERGIEAIPNHHPKDVQIHLDLPSVGATEHLMITAAMMNETTTILSNCAREPEVVELQNFLNSIGANVLGAGTTKIRIIGASKFSGSHFKIIGDRIEAGTYVIAAMAGRGEVVVKGVDPSTVNFLSFLRKLGGDVKMGKHFIAVKPSQLTAFSLSTAPYPGFPTDLQPQTTVLACKANGISKITENIFENRFGHVRELKKMGAKIEQLANSIKVKGPQQFKAARLLGKDLRETAAITIAAALADGISEIENFEIMFRGYENVIEKLDQIGIRIVV